MLERNHSSSTNSSNNLGTTACVSDRRALDVSSVRACASAATCCRAHSSTGWFSSCISRVVLLLVAIARQTYSSHPPRARNRYHHLRSSSVGCTRARTINKQYNPLVLCWSSSVSEWHRYFLADSRFSCPPIVASIYIEYRYAMTSLALNRTSRKLAPC